jgi:hypothetical protein
MLWANECLRSRSIWYSHLFIYFILFYIKLGVWFCVGTGGGHLSLYDLRFLLPLQVYDYFCFDSCFILGNGILWEINI